MSLNVRVYHLPRYTIASQNATVHMFKKILQELTGQITISRHDLFDNYTPDNLFTTTGSID